MKLDYFTLLSPESLYLHNIGNVKSPKLKEISSIGYYTYNHYLNILLLDSTAYYSKIDEDQEKYFSTYTEQERNIILDVKNQYSTFTETEKISFPFYRILVFDPQIRDAVENALNFFFVDKVKYDKEENAFFTYSGKTDADGEELITGAIYVKNYSEVVDIILQRVNIKSKTSDYEAPQKIKNKTRVEKMLEKFKKSEDVKKKTEKDTKFDLPNIMSSISSHHNSINMINVWDLTVYQLYDQFKRERMNDSFRIASTSVSMHGNKDNKFDETIWYSSIYEN